MTLQVFDKIPFENAFRITIRIALTCLCMGLAGCGRKSDFPSRPITIVCPWAAGGGTDRVSRQIALQLEKRLGAPVNVINATGGKGVTGHNRGLTARADGYTIAMITFELNTMHWMGLTDLSFRDCIPLASVNEDYAAIFVRSDAQWQSLSDLEDEIRRRPTELTGSGTAVGGAWHLALAGWLNATQLAPDAVTWIPSEGSNPSLQQLISGGVDLVCCSLPEARSLLEADQVRALGVMSPRRAVGFEHVATFPEQGNNWTLGGWRGLAVPPETPADIVQKLAEVLEDIVNEDASNPESFAAFMRQQKFDNTSRGPEEFGIFLAENDRKLGALLSSDAMQSVSQDRFSPMTYPVALLGLLGIATIGLFVDLKRTPPAQTQAASSISPQGKLSLSNFVAIVAAPIAYIAVAESLGFLIAAFAILFLLLIKFGSSPLQSLGIATLVVPSIYLVFAFVLRVPLPQGWFG